MKYSNMGKALRHLCLVLAFLVSALFLNSGPAPAAATAAGGGVETMKQAEDNSLRITIIYDNYAFDQRMETEWGFAALIEYGGEKVLFDTGGDGRRLLGNAERLGIDLSRIRHVVLSHIHFDHTGGLEGFLSQVAEEVRPRVYTLPSFPTDFGSRIGSRAEIVEVKPFQLVAGAIYTTGEIIGVVNEQVLVITTDRGLVVVTGCAHPGIVEIVEKAKEHFGEDIHLVIGGFHLRGKPEAELRSIVADFRRLGVRKVSPTHCTGDEAISMFMEEFGEDYIRGGAGRIIIVEPPD